MRALEFVDRRGRSPFADWIDGLDAPVAAKVVTFVARLEADNFSNVKGLGGGLHECRMSFGAGYRIYFGMDGDALIILQAGGSKRRQSRDIAAARERWRDYLDRKSEA
jgi:putative addiction module killer protein